MNFDAFSSGQIGSKLWACEQLEYKFDRIDKIWIYGGWYGLLPFLLRVRDKIKIQEIRSFDIDNTCQPIADLINENWVFDNWKFKAYTQDCNNLSDVPNDVDLIINTSTEHFISLAWFDSIPEGTHVLFQGSDMIHDDHIFNFENLEHFKEILPLQHYDFIGEKEFVYPDWKFKRFMTIGIK